MRSWSISHPHIRQNNIIRILEHQQQQSYGGDDDDDDGGRYFAEGKQIIFERNIHVLWDFIEHIYVYSQSIE